MITAKEAAQMAGPSAQDYIDFIESEIKTAANNKARSIMLRSEPYARWLYSKPDAEAQAAMDILKMNGYKLEHYYKEHSIAVDMALVIKW